MVTQKEVDDGLDKLQRKWKKENMTKKKELIDTAEPDVIPPPPPELVAKVAAEPVDKTKQQAAKEPEVHPAASVPASNEEQKTEVARANYVKEKAVVILNQQGIPLPADFDAAFRIADAMYRGGAFPKWVKSPIQALAVSQFCRSLGLDPMTGVQHTCEIAGRLSLWGEGPLASVRASKKLLFLKEIFITKDYTEISLQNKNLDAPLYAAVCQMQRNTGERIERYFTNEDEKKAMKGLPDVWRGYQRIMYKRKARAEVIKDLFGDVICGARIAEYDDNMAPDMGLGVIQPAEASLAEKMNGAIEDKSAEV